MPINFECCKIILLQACRSRFNDKNHENFDPGVMIPVQISASGDNALEGPGQKHERKRPLLDTADAKQRISKPSEQEQNKRVQEVLQVKL